MASRDFPHTFRNRDNVTHEVLNREIHDWHVNDPLGLSRSAGQMFQATGLRDGQMINPPSEPSLMYHSGVSGTLSRWRPQSEIGGGGAGGGSGVIASGFWKNDGTASATQADARMAFLSSATALATSFARVTRIVFSNMMGTTETHVGQSIVNPSAIDTAAIVLDAVAVGDYIIMTSTQLLGTTLRYRVTSITSRAGEYVAEVSVIANTGVSFNAAAVTWSVSTVSKAYVDATDVFGVGTTELKTLGNNAKALYVEEDKFRSRPLLEAVNDYLPYKLQRPANISGFVYTRNAGSANGTINFGITNGVPTSMTVRAHNAVEYEQLQRRLQVGNIVRVENSDSTIVVEFPINANPTLNNNRLTVVVVPDPDRVVPDADFVNISQGDSVKFNIRSEFLSVRDIRTDDVDGSTVFPMTQKAVRDSIDRDVDLASRSLRAFTNNQISQNNRAFMRTGTYTSANSNAWEGLYSNLPAGVYWFIGSIRLGDADFDFIPFNAMFLFSSLSTTAKTFGDSQRAAAIRRNGQTIELRATFNAKVDYWLLSAVS